MSLTPIGMAFGIVAILFIAFAAVAARATDRVWGVGSRVSSPPPGPTAWGTIIAEIWLGATVEALLLVLLASLWFASLGHGGWLLLFLLIGALVGVAEWRSRRRAIPTSGGTELGLLAVCLSRYVIAGLISIWLLS